MINITEKVTIIIPSYNRNELLNKVLPSYLNQTAVKEILIVDDGSEIPLSESLSIEFIANKKLRIVRHNRVLGLCAARNTGIMEAKTELIFFGEDDLILSNDHISNLLEERERLAADMICGVLVSQKHDESFEEALLSLKSSNSIFDSKFITINFSCRITEAIKIPFSHAIFLAPTEILKRYLFNYAIGGPSFRREDNEMQLFLTKKGYTLYITPQASSFHFAQIKGKGGGTRRKYPLFIYIFSGIVNTWLVISEYHELIAPYFNNMPRKAMLRKSVFWLAYINTKRWLQNNYKFIAKLIKIYDAIKINYSKLRTW